VPLGAALAWGASEDRDASGPGHPAGQDLSAQAVVIALVVEVQSVVRNGPELEQAALREMVHRSHERSAPEEAVPPWSAELQAARGGGVPALLEALGRPPVIVRLAPPA
jgi:hypothetical protein